MWHPIRLAEDYAMAILTGGVRVSWAWARLHSARWETVGAPMLDNAANKSCSRADGGAVEAFSTRSRGGILHKHYESAAGRLIAGTTCASSPACRGRSTGRSSVAADRQRQTLDLIAPAGSRA